MRDILHFAIQRTEWKYYPGIIPNNQTMESKEVWKYANFRGKLQVPEQSYSTIAGSTKNGDNQPSANSKRCRKKAVLIEIRDFIKQNVCVPVRNCFNLKDWRSKPSNMLIKIDNYIV